MKLRRVRAGDQVEVQFLGDDGTWRPAPNRQALGGVVFDHDWEMGMSERHRALSEHLLPFHPASFRDFMLYEQHNIDELFATGTLPGGSGMETGNWLRPGDTLTLTIDAIGEILHVITE